MTTEKRLNLEVLEKKAVHANKKEKIYIPDAEGEEVAFYYNPVFSKSKRTQLIQQLLEDIKTDYEQNTNFLETEGQEIAHLEYLIVRQFSDVYQWTQNLTLEQHNAVKQMLVDTELMDLMMNEVFDIEEIAKVSNEWNLAKQRAYKLNQQLEATATLVQQAKNKQRFHEKKIKAVGK